MRRRATSILFLLMIAIGMLFAGAVSAQEPATVDVTVIDQNGDPVIVANPGDEVAADVVVSANEQTIGNPYVYITVDPVTGMQFEPDKAMMWDGTQWIINDPTDPTKNFFFRATVFQERWVWNINLITSIMQPGEVVGLIAPAIVSDTGDITVNAELSSGPNLLAQDSYTFLSEEPSDNTATANAATVPMQNTGAPVALALLGMLGIIGGTIYNRIR